MRVRKLQALWVGAIRWRESGVSCKMLACQPELLVDGVQLEEESLCQTVLALYELSCHVQAAVLLLWVSVVTSNLPVQRLDDKPWWHVAERRRLEAGVIVAQYGGAKVRCTLHGHVD